MGPCTPGRPSLPGGPSRPCGPTGPWIPTAPSPFSPFSPTGPSLPSRPAGPGSPCCPSLPGSPGGPASHCRVYNCNDSLKLTIAYQKKETKLTGLWSNISVTIGVKIDFNSSLVWNHKSQSSKLFLNLGGAKRNFLALTHALFAFSSKIAFNPAMSDSWQVLRSLYADVISKWRMMSDFRPDIFKKGQAATGVLRTTIRVSWQTGFFKLQFPSVVPIFLLRVTEKIRQFEWGISKNLKWATWSVSRHFLWFVLLKKCNKYVKCQCEIQYFMHYSFAKALAFFPWSKAPKLSIFWKPNQIRSSLQRYCLLGLSGMIALHPSAAFSPGFSLTFWVQPHQVTSVDYRNSHLKRCLSTPSTGWWQHQDWIWPQKISSPISKFPKISAMKSWFGPNWRFAWPSSLWYSTLACLST